MQFIGNTWKEHACIWDIYMNQTTEIPLANFYLRMLLNIYGLFAEHMHSPPVHFVPLCSIMNIK